jgi:hypothetical protein
MGNIIIDNYINLHKGLEVNDIYKFIYQMVFGCEHLVVDRNSAVVYLMSEYLEIQPKDTPLFESLGQQYVRVNLESYLFHDLNPNDLINAFIKSSELNKNDKDYFRELCLMYIDSGLFNKLDYQAVHHSEQFRKLYNPHYRVIDKRYIDTIIGEKKWLNNLS